MILNLFTDIIKNGFNSLISICLFIAIVYNDKVLSSFEIKIFKRIANLLAVIIFLSALDNTLFLINDNKYLMLNIIVVYIRLCLAPLLSMYLVVIFYRKYYIEKPFIFYIPIIINIILCTLVLTVSPISFIDTTLDISFIELELGALFIASLYSIFLLISTIFTNYNKPHKRVEQTYLIFFELIILTAGIIKFSYNLRYLLWTAITICMTSYFFILTYERLLYDQLTKAYTRMVYQKDIEKFAKNKDFLFAMLDINNLKELNDYKGHAAGDKAIQNIINTIFKNINKNDKIYRFGGDEFAIISFNDDKQSLIDTLIKTQKDLTPIENIKVSFAFAVVEHRFTEDFHHTMERADALMYDNKRKMKERQLTVQE